MTANGPRGTIRVSGAWALYPLMVRWGEEYLKIYPEIRIDFVSWILTNGQEHVSDVGHINLSKERLTRI